MATTGTRKNIGSNALAFPITDANGNPALAAASVPIDTAGNPLNGKATIADGDAVTLGTKADAAATDSTSSWTAISLLKGLWALLSGSLKVVGSVANNAADSGNPVKVGGVFNNTGQSLTDGSRGNLALDQYGCVLSRLTVGSGNSGGNYNINGGMTDGLSNTFIGYQFAIRGYTFNGSTWDRAKKASVTSRIASSANTTNATVAKASAGDLFAIQGYNTTASVVYLKLYNKATAPTVGTDTPVKTIAIPPNAAIPANCAWANGLYFSTGIAYALTGAAADNDTTAVAAGAVTGLNLDYQ